MTLDDLWNSAASGHSSTEPAKPSSLPEPARRYLAHAIAPTAPRATAVRLQMHGEIKLQRWHPFCAEEVIHIGLGMIWQARLRMFGLPVRGSDRIVDGHAAMRWRVLGLIPLANDSGPDVRRSALGRLAAEQVWLPSALNQAGTVWRSTGPQSACAQFTLHGAAVELQLNIADHGALQSVSLMRWGNPDGAGYRLLPFGARVEAEATCAGYTIPSCLRIGWYFGTPRFEPEGEFFRVTVEHAAFR